MFKANIRCEFTFQLWFSTLVSDEGFVCESEIIVKPGKGFFGVAEQQMQWGSRGPEGRFGSYTKTGSVGQGRNSMSLSSRREEWECRQLGKGWKTVQVGWHLLRVDKGQWIPSVPDVSRYLSWIKLIQENKPELLYNTDLNILLSLLKLNHGERAGSWDSWRSPTSCGETLRHSAFP